MGKTKNVIYHEVTSNNEKDNSVESPEYLEYRKKWDENPKKQIVENFPIHLDFELTTYCNLDCHKKICTFKCPYNLIDGEVLPKKDFDFELFKKIIDEGVKKGLCSIKLSYRGEPLLHPKVVEFVRYAKEKGVIDVMLNTNATLLSPELINDLMEANLDKILCGVVSIDKDTVDSIRGEGIFSNMVDNIKKIKLLKQEKNVKKPIVIVQIFDMESSSDHITEFSREWGEMADKIAVDKLNEFILKNEDFAEETDFTCPYLWQRLFILYNGDVMMCCGDHKDIDSLGNARKDTIESIWKGEKLNTIRKMHEVGESGNLSICSRCGFRKSYIVNNLAV